MKPYLLWGSGMGAALLIGALWWGYDYWAVPSPLSDKRVWQELQAYPIYTPDYQPAPIASLEGKVVLLDFVYTRCASVCPRLQSRLRQTLQALPSSEKLVAISISLDPERDTPEQIQAHLMSYGVPEHTWYFWRPQTQRWAIQAAEQIFGLTAATLSSEEILHSDAILLIDCSGRIRGVYRSEDERLLSHTRKLLRLCDTPS